MGNRLSKLVTKTGDDGTTGISGNIRVDKDSVRIEAIGTVDELNAQLGMVLACNIPEELAVPINDIQQILFNLGGELAMPEYTLVEDKHVSQIEEWVESFNEQLPPLKEFILPRGSMATASCHVARTVCRRAERRLVTLSRAESINPNLKVYLNRLSDLLFVFCRLMAKNDGAKEEMWQSRRNA